MRSDENSAKHMASTLSKLDIVILKTRNLPIFQYFHYFFTISQSIPRTSSKTHFFFCNFFLFLF